PLLDHVHGLDAGNQAGGGVKGLQSHHRPESSFDGTVVLLHKIVNWHACLARLPGARVDASAEYRRGTGIGATGACLAGRPEYLMSCELELLTGCPFDLPGCAASANP